jgi:hypothetical protein
MQLPNMNSYPGPNSVIILDNCSTHKSEAVREAVEASGKSFTSSCCIVLCPHIPIEAVFSSFYHHIHPTSTRSKRALVAVRDFKYAFPSIDQCNIVKAWLRRYWRRLQDSQFPEQDLADACFMAVTAENTCGWFAHSGHL